MDAILTAFCAIAAGEAGLMIAGGVESMSRAPFVLPKADTAFSRNAEIHDTTIGWRFINPGKHMAHGTDFMPQTGQNLADDYGISRDAQGPWRWPARPRWQRHRRAGGWQKKSPRSSSRRRRAIP
jgi:acetyl-CoA acetyltransferase